VGLHIQAGSVTPASITEVPQLSYDPARLIMHAVKSYGIAVVLNLL
jgi:hypothetical protein